MTPTMHTYDAGDREAWDDRVAAGPGGHLLQSWAWGELKRRFGWRARRVAVDGACAQVLFRPLPAGLGTIAYVPEGPVADYGDTAALRRLLAAIEPMARRARAICLKVEPHRPDDPALAATLHDLGFRPSPQEVQPRRTLVVDLAPEPDDILARMHSKGRYNVRLAGRRGVTVRPGGEADLGAFYDLMETTSARNEFGIHSRAYYAAAHHLFVPEHGCLLLAEHEGDLLAVLVAFAFAGEAIYMYGASSNEKRNLMAPYLLQWEAMRRAKARGCHTYDLWGVPDEEEDVLEAKFTGRSDGLWGVYGFKRRFGGRLVRWAGAWDLVYAPLRYRAYLLGLGLLRGRLAG
jgi:lipid II:glycine glycyltransferase (peptidoglycan interpeptide bridge formation enzyme)